MATIEIEEFHLASGVSREAFVALDAAYQEHCYLNRPGLLRRTTASSSDAWAVITWWAGDPDDAERSPVSSAWLQTIEPSSYQRHVYTSLD